MFDYFLVIKITYYYILLLDIIIFPFLVPSGNHTKSY